MFVEELWMGSQPGLHPLWVAWESSRHGSAGGIREIKTHVHLFHSSSCAKWSHLFCPSEPHFLQL